MKPWIATVIAAAFLAIAGLSAEGCAADERTGDQAAAHAFAAAYRAFAEALPEQVGDPGQGGDPELFAFARDIRNYRIEFEEDASHYLISFHFKKYKGGYLRGGGALYSVDKKTMKARFVEGYE
jgi:hypothetical protein